MPLKRSSASVRERGQKLKRLGGGRDAGQERLVSSADDDRKTKSRLLMEIQKQQDGTDKKDATTLKVCNTSTYRYRSFMLPHDSHLPVNN